jgi:hypothetical protein
MLHWLTWSAVWRPKHDAGSSMVRQCCMGFVSDWWRYFLCEIVLLPSRFASCWHRYFGYAVEDARR